MGLFKLGGLAMVFIFVGMVLGMFIAGGGEIEGAPVLDDPSRQQVDGEEVTWVELRDTGVFVGTTYSGFAMPDFEVILPNGERHKMFEVSDGDINEQIVVSYDEPSLPSGNYTVESIGVGYNTSTNSQEVIESHTVYLEQPTD